MLDGLFERLFDAASVSPDYAVSRCIAAKRTKEACSACRDVCPHSAITIGRRVEIDDVDCTGCGLCVQACPSEALEPKGRVRPGLPLRCSQVDGEAQSVVCLGRLRASDLLRLANRNGGVRLARADCASCPVGTEAVLAALEAQADTARALASLFGREVSVEVIEVDRLDETSSGERVSRRDLFRGGLRSMQIGMADALAPFDTSDEDGGGMPREASRHLALLRAAQPEPEATVPWSLPRVLDGCIMCPVCTQICPTDAFSRDFEPIEVDGAALRLDPAKCVGCEACVDACPVDVIRMDHEVTWGELSSGTQVAYHRRPKDGPAGSVAR